MTRRLSAAQARRERTAEVLRRVTAALLDEGPRHHPDTGLHNVDGSRYITPPEGWPPDDDLSPAVVDMLADRLRELEEGCGGPFTVWDAVTAPPEPTGCAAPCGGSPANESHLLPSGAMVWQAECECGWYGPKRAFETVADLDRLHHRRSGIGALSPHP